MTQREASSPVLQWRTMVDTVTATIKLVLRIRGQALTMIAFWQAGSNCRGMCQETCLPAIAAVSKLRRQKVQKGHPPCVLCPMAVCVTAAGPGCRASGLGDPGPREPRPRGLLPSHTSPGANEQDGKARFELGTSVRRTLGRSTKLFRPLGRKPRLLPGKLSRAVMSASSRRHHRPCSE